VETLVCRESRLGRLGDAISDALGRYRGPLRYRHRRPRRRLAENYRTVQPALSEPTVPPSGTLARLFWLSRRRSETASTKPSPALEGSPAAGRGRKKAQKTEKPKRRRMSAAAHKRLAIPLRFRTFTAITREWARFVRTVPSGRGVSSEYQISTTSPF